MPEAPQPVSGYRQTRRASNASRTQKRAERKHRAATAAVRGWRGFKNALLVIVQGLALIGMTVIVLLLIANGVNTFARWNARRLAQNASSHAGKAQRARENVLVIGVEGDTVVGYLAMRIDTKGEQIFGIAIPDGAFMDIPGRGFDRAGEAYTAGADIALATVSNYFTVPFNSYVVVPSGVYGSAVRAQSVSGIVAAVTDSNLSAAELEALGREIGGVEQKNVALVPMPVKPIKLGEQTYYEPQRAEIADLLKQWWGVDASQGERTTRVIVYNGAGVPGVAGKAAQELIRAGFRVVDTKNADRFAYKTTEIVVKRGDVAQGEAVKKALGVGNVKVDLTNADVTDVVVIIGKDYRATEARKETP